jgi:hypothetical protein
MNRGHGGSRFGLDAATGFRAALFRVPERVRSLTRHERKLPEKAETETQLGLTGEESGGGAWMTPKGGRIALIGRPGE